MIIPTNIYCPYIVINRLHADTRSSKGWEKLVGAILANLNLPNFLMQGHAFTWMGEFIIGMA